MFKGCNFYDLSVAHARLEIIVSLLLTNSYYSIPTKLTGLLHDINSHFLGLTFVPH